jgi:hypothetical protein
VIERRIPPAGDPFSGARVFRPERGGEDPHPHACYDGAVYLTYTAFDEEVGDEVERIEAVPCRRCAEEERV